MNFVQTCLPRVHYHLTLPKGSKLPRRIIVKQLMVVMISLILLLTSVSSDDVRPTTQRRRLDSVSVDHVTQLDQREKADKIIRQFRKNARKSRSKRSQSDKAFYDCVTAHPWEVFDQSKSKILGTPFGATHYKNGPTFIEKILCCYVAFKAGTELTNEVLEGQTPPCTKLYSDLLARFNHKLRLCRDYVCDTTRMGHMEITREGAFIDSNSFLLEEAALIRVTDYVLEWFQSDHKYESFERTNMIEHTLLGNDYICTSGSILLKCILDILVPKGTFLLRTSDYWGHMILSLETENGPRFLESVPHTFLASKTSSFQLGRDNYGTKIRFYGLGMKMFADYSSFVPVPDEESLGHYIFYDLDRSPDYENRQERIIQFKIAVRILYTEWRKDTESDTLDHLITLLRPYTDTIRDDWDWKCGKMDEEKTKIKIHSDFLDEMVTTGLTRRDEAYKAVREEHLMMWMDKRFSKEDMSFYRFWLKFKSTRT